MHSLIQRVNLVENPNFDIIESKKFQSTISNAFSISSFTAIQPDFPFFFEKEWKISFAIKMLSCIDLPEEKALCSGLVTLGITLLSLEARILDIILYVVEQRLIGL